jgi:hypothetical protein
VGHFCLLDPDPEFGSTNPIESESNPDPIRIQSGSGSATLAKIQLNDIVHFTSRYLYSKEVTTKGKYNLKPSKLPLKFEIINYRYHLKLKGNANL